MNCELERIWKEAVVASFKVQSRHLPGGTEENHENPNRVSGLWAEILKPRPPNTKQKRRPLGRQLPVKEYHFCVY
jgi:hypothetical protein